MCSLVQDNGTEALDWEVFCRLAASNAEALSLYISIKLLPLANAFTAVLSLCMNGSCQP